jgi:hypothetical protein
MSPLTQNNPHPPCSLTKLIVFCSIGNVKWKDINFILIKNYEQCLWSQFPWKFEVYGGRPIYPSWNKVVILGIEINLFCHCFLAFGLEKGVLNM